MRIGIYLGRHTGNGGGIAVYAKSFVEHSVSLLESTVYRDTEIVFYGDKVVLDQVLLNNLSFASVLTNYTDSIFSFSADSYFKVLPNGRRCRVLVRLLPYSPSRWFNYWIDQLVIPLLCMWDRVNLLHSLANYAILWSSVKQLLTVHDLFQAWPELIYHDVPKPSGSKLISSLKGDSQAVRKLSLKKRFVLAVNRVVFSKQFKALHHIVTDSRFVAQQIEGIYKVGKERISYLPLGLDGNFISAWSEKDSDVFAERVKAFEKKNNLQEGFVLFFASSDPRKNLSSALQSWRSLADNLKTRRLLIRALDAAAKKEVAKELSQEIKSGRVSFLEWVDRGEMPCLYYSAGVLFCPTLAEGFGLPVLEALAMGCYVVTGPLDFLQNGGDIGEGVYLCDPFDLKQIGQALGRALFDLDNSPKKLGINSIPLRTGETAARGRPRTMFDLVKEVFEVYHRVFNRPISSRSL